MLPVRGACVWSLIRKLRPHMLLLICCSVISNFLETYRLKPTRLLDPWDFPGKNSSMGCHFLLQGMFPTQKSNPLLLHWQTNSSLTEPPDKPQDSTCHRAKKKRRIILEALTWIGMRSLTGQREMIYFCHPSLRSWDLKVPKVEVMCLKIRANC